MKKGMARRVKLVVLEYILAGTMASTSISPRATKKKTDVNPMETAMGSPSMMSPTRTKKISAVSMVLPSPEND
jgi:hypothetical protein